MQTAAGHFEEGLGGGGEEQWVRLPPCAEEQRVKHLGYRDDDVEVRHRQQIGLLPLEPAPWFKVRHVGQ